MRVERGLSLREAARRAGVVKETISDIERGHTHPYDVTLAKLAKAYEVPVEELLVEPAVAGKAETPQKSGPADVHRLFAERQTRADWQEAVDGSRRFRSQAKERLRGQLSLWEAARDDGSSYEKRREFLDAIGRILDEADSVSRNLLQNLGEGLGRMAEPSPEGTQDPYWTECQEADTLYHELFGMVGGVGLSVRLEKTDQALEQWRHEIVQSAA